jgi:CheY-like chemotaxis protein
LDCPLLHGSELASRLKQDDSTKDIPIVALTARRLTELGGNASILGYARFLEKPISPVEVLRVVEQIIGRASLDQGAMQNRLEALASDAEEMAEPDAPARVAVDPEVEAIGKRLAQQSPSVLEIWERLVTEEPWFSLPREQRAGFLTEVIGALADAVLQTSSEEESCRKVIIAAAAHGRGRRDQEIPESLIAIEFHLLRQAIWRYLTQEFGPSEHLHATISRLNGLISLSLNACMWGYFRDEIEAQGMWDAAVDRLVASACTGAPAASRQPAGA